MDVDTDVSPVRRLTAAELVVLGKPRRVLKTWF